jgi:cytochrome c
MIADGLQVLEKALSSDADLPPTKKRSERMKAVYVAVMAAAGIVMAGQAQADEALAKAKGCMACHAIDKKVTGPAYKDVAAKYKPADAAKLAESIQKGTGPAGKGWQKEGKAALPFMPANNVTPEEAKKLAAWVLSQK